MANLKEGIQKEIGESVSEGISTFSPENINQLANTLGNSLKVLLQDKQEKLADMKDQYEVSIKERPFTNVASAFAAGVVLGLLFRRN